MSEVKNRKNIDQKNKNNNDQSSNSKDVKNEEEKPHSTLHLKAILTGLIVLWLMIYAFKPQLFHGSKSRNTRNQYYDDVLSPITVLNGLKTLSKFDERNHQCYNKTVLVGYNTNLDLIVDAIDLLGHLSLPKTRAAIQSHDLISSTSQLESTFSYYFESGSAAERFVDDEITWKEILEVSNKLEKKTYFTGGNAGIMANVLAEDGCNVYLSGVVGSILKDLLNPKIRIISNPGDDKVDDEVHLIMEYNKNSGWYGVSPPRSNRFIISRDISNSKLSTLESLHDSIPTLLDPRPDLLLLSGLHLLTSETQLSRTQAMVEQISKVPFSSNPSHFLNNNYNIPIHLELASISDQNYMKLLASQVVPNVDSLGLNEQELGFLYLSTGGSKYSLNDFISPEVRVTVEAIKHIFNQVIFKPELNFDPNIPLEKRVTSRIHFHYLTYHIIAIREGFTKQWGSSPSSIAAVAASSLEATKNACNFTQISLKLPSEIEVDFDYTPGATKTLNLNLESPVISWRDIGIEFYLSPVLVCSQPSKTVGLGDSISTISYLYQTIKPQ